MAWLIVFFGCRDWCVGASVGERVSGDVFRNEKLCFSDCSGRHPHSPVHLDLVVEPLVLSELLRSLSQGVGRAVTVMFLQVFSGSYSLVRSGVSGVGSRTVRKTQFFVLEPTPDTPPPPNNRRRPNRKLEAGDSNPPKLGLQILLNTLLSPFPSQPALLHATKG